MSMKEGPSGGLLAAHKRGRLRRPLLVAESAGATLPTMESQTGPELAGPVPSPPPSPGRQEPEFKGQHLTTFAHEGRFWDVYLEFVDDPRKPDSCRARLCYVPTDQAEHEGPARTAVIIIEPSYEEAVSRAATFDQHHLGAMLRSVIRA